MVVTLHYVGFHPNLILQGFEQVRLKYPVERVYLFYDEKPDRYGAVSRYNVKRLAEKLSFFQPVTVKVNPLNQQSVYSKFYQVLWVEREKETLIDITDMPPLMVACVTSVSMMFPNSKIYAVQPEQIGEFIPDPDTPEFARFIAKKDSLRASSGPGAVQQIEKPGVGLLLDEHERIESKERSTEEDKKLEKEMRILQMLYLKNGSASSLTQLIQWMGENWRNQVVKATYSRMIKEMEEKGLLVRELNGKSRVVKLTRLGEAIAEAYINLNGVQEQRPPARQIREAVPVTEI
jgi:predicted transcriptional regulator